MTIDSAVYEAAAAERRRREHVESVEAIRRRQAAFDAQQQEAEQGRHDREVAKSTAKREAEQRKVEAAQTAQWVWATRRNELRDLVAALRRDIQGCEERMRVAPMPEASAASSERDVLKYRLATAEAEYAVHDPVGSKRR